MKSSKKLAPKLFEADHDKVVSNNSGKVNKTVINSSRNSMRISNIRAIGKLTFLTSNRKKIFNHL